MGGSGTRLVLIDRDGVINRDSDRYIRSVAEWDALPGSLEAIAALNRAGFSVAVITNQSGVGRGLFTPATLEEIHAEMCRAVKAAGGEIAGIYVCPHRPEDECECRKPKPGLLLRAAADFGVRPGGVPFIGDKASDAQAALAAGARPILVGAADRTGVPGTVERHADLAAAARELIAKAGAG